MNLYNINHYYNNDLDTLNYLKELEEFEYTTKIQYNDINYADNINNLVFNINANSVFIRAYFWFSGTQDPQLGYLNFYKNIPMEEIKILHFYNEIYEAFVTVDVNWKDKTIKFSNIKLPNEYWRLRIEQYS